jgi:hypothetical protein
MKKWQQIKSMSIFTEKNTVEGFIAYLVSFDNIRHEPFMIHDNTVIGVGYWISVLYNDSQDISDAKSIDVLSNDDYIKMLKKSKITEKYKKIIAVSKCEKETDFIEYAITHKSENKIFLVFHIHKQPDFHIGDWVHYTYNGKSISKYEFISDEDYRYLLKLHQECTQHATKIFSNRPDTPIYIYKIVWDWFFDKLKNDEHFKCDMLISILRNRTDIKYTVNDLDELWDMLSYKNI